MAGIYIHIPFCKQACHYCDFHFSTSMRRKLDIIQAICREIVLQQHYLSRDIIQTIYFGGGTPSLLTEAELAQIFDTLTQYFTIAPEAEITLEANPDDLTAAKLQNLKKTPVNRLSIGLQSFHEPHLRLMNRAHSAAESFRAVKMAQDAGFTNLTVDLIYGIPADNHLIWEQDLEQVFALQVPHVSSYALTIEPKTALGNWTKKGKFTPSEDEFVATQFEILLAQMQANGYEQYEISNFCKPGWESRHNSNYWKGVPYVGIGPSAHSFNGSSRQYNVANNTQYLAAINQNTLPATVEVLSLADQANEYLMTTLRTIWGCNLNLIKARYGFDLQLLHGDYLATIIQKGLAQLKDHTLILTNPGKLLADQITLDLFIAE
ncbi:radical SAM family heme chaperone HemW [Adhaeribacter pallidiroseus]|uniref:Heme chaperone HemW n=1 Tax=Adhaeribacter pallidiroseus TaxID=2072847 RepID=A0A369QEB3_9BACT|nr:radical SAM family heme chaperone HemW [Adhaeribacter pallidiroseus]RDC61587.1 Coproporphyrinogen dehydrogenase [Adhaeribacter pallidiroseus]